ncbi:MAG: hypothetical protein ACYCTF_02530 [Acidiferrobacter sp.]
MPKPSLALSEENQEGLAYLQRLQKDIPSFLGVALVIISTLLTVITTLVLLHLNATHPNSSSPEVLVLLAVFAIWFNYLKKYRPLAVALFKFIMVMIIPYMIVVIIATNIWRSQSIVFIYAMAGFCSLLDVAAMGFYRKSILRAEGPAR